MFGPHGEFIIACYGVSALVLAMLTAWIVIDGRAVRRQLDTLESRGVRRRSAGREPS
ncbi:heme exporter protein CcmD [Ancylobacter pratisalsi]|uniref:Heme exporter protein D n=1 Tax=Ancylobacter pratisalsi TaxID=1745854 RepID=A0A6P1YJC1_9HYPH|nr:heme exporter protein CcmD [Ancylobacter pratisalsi]QIB33242.1 heme exporter protein CcmD [Ancylobacter pratisalsi]